MKSLVLVNGGRDSEKSVNWSDSDTLLLEKSIGKAIVSFQIPEVLSDEAIQVFLCKKFESAKRLDRFKPRNFSKVKRYKFFYTKNFESAKWLYRFNPRIFKGEAIQVLLRQKIWISKAIVSFQTPEFLKMKQYKYFWAKNFETTKRIYHLKTCDTTKL